jgi:hypothetical protein
MSPFHAFTTGKGAGNRRNRTYPLTAGPFPLQARSSFPTYPFQPLPTPAGPAPYRFDLSQLLTPEDLAAIEKTGTLSAIQATIVAPSRTS